MKLYGILFFAFCLKIFAEDQDINTIFSEKEITGTLIISSFDGKTEYIHNEARAKKQVLPASTFKIPNTLIALEENVLKNDSEVVIWDGVKRDLPDWNKDQTLVSAFKYSCVWFYQKIAEKVGIKKYNQYLKMFIMVTRKSAPMLQGSGLKETLQFQQESRLNFCELFYKVNSTFKTGILKY